MPVWLSAFASAITTFNRWLFKATVWLMAVVVPVMLYEVVMRYFFNAPTVWGMELAVLLFGPYFLFGGPYLLHLKGHVALDLVRQRLSNRWVRRLDLVNLNRPGFSRHLRASNLRPYRRCHVELATLR